MKINIFDKVEIEEIKKIEKELSEKYKFIVKLHNLLNKWNYVVNNILKGYNDNVYEYINDLAVRDILQEIIEMSSNVLSKKIIKLCSSMDNIFINETEEFSKLISSDAKDRNKFWLFRIPKKRSADFEKEINDIIIDKG